MAKEDITIKTEDGTVPARLFRPAGGQTGPSQPGVIVYMDAFGLRPGLDQMAERIADAGYAVLVPDLFYRYGDYGTLDARTAFSDPATKEKIMGMITGTTVSQTRRDTGHYLAALGQNGASGRVGTVGYCMGGEHALAAAAHYPDKVAAAASFHGGGLASDAPDSPHLLAGQVGAELYFGFADNDRSSFPDDMKQRLDEALTAAGVEHRIETYAGLRHGWVPSDTPAHDAAGAERHFRALFELFGSTLATQPST